MQACRFDSARSGGDALVSWRGGVGRDPASSDVATAAASPPAAATIILNNLGGVEPGTGAYAGFTAAANFWAHEIANPITIRLDVGFGHLGPNILGSTGSRATYVPQP